MNYQGDEVGEQCLLMASFDAKNKHNGVKQSVFLIAILYPPSNSKKSQYLREYITQYICVTLSVWWRVRSMDLSHNPY